MKKNSIINLSLMMMLGVSSNVLSAEIETNSALMQAMDKVTGRVNKITVPVYFSNISSRVSLPIISI